MDSLANAIQKMWSDLIDNDTLCLAFIFVLCLMRPEYSKEAIIGLLGFVGGKGMK